MVSPSIRKLWVVVQHQGQGCWAQGSLAGREVPIQDLVWTWNTRVAPESSGRAAEEAVGALCLKRRTKLWTETQM